MDVLKMFVAGVAIVTATLFGLFLFDFILALPVMWLWNASITSVFGTNAITYWQAFCLLVLSQILLHPSTNSTVVDSSKS